MKPDTPFPIPEAWTFGVQIAIVASVQDATHMGRVQLRLVAPDADGEALLWARVAVPFAGADAGAFFIPDIGDEVVVAFIAGDPRHPVVIGSLWNGARGAPERLPGSRVDRWSITGRNGTRIAIVEAGPGQETISLETPAGVSATVTDEGGGKITCAAAGNSFTLDPSGTTLNAPAGVTITTGKATVTAGQVTVNSAFANFSGVIKCATLITNSVVSASYTPGAGNIW